MAVFARRHYVKIAEVLRRQYELAAASTLERYRMECVIVEMADMFAADNRLFDRKAFYRAAYPATVTRISPGGSPL